MPGIYSRDPNSYSDRGLSMLKWTPARLAITKGVERKIVGTETHHWYQGKRILMTWKEQNEALTDLFKMVPRNIGVNPFYGLVKTRYLNLRYRSIVEWLNAQPARSKAPGATDLTEMPTGVSDHQPICIFINHRSTKALEKLLHAIKVGGQGKGVEREVKPTTSDGETKCADERSKNIPAPELDKKWESDEYAEEEVQYKPRKRKAQEMA